MTRKDYIRIAAVVRQSADSLGAMLADDEPTQATKERCAHKLQAVRLIASRLADSLAEDNARFNRARFLAACGVDC